MSKDTNLFQVTNYLNDDAAVFRPIRTTEEKLKKIIPTNGDLYFTTDSKKIYLGSKEDTLISMGGSSNIFYAYKAFGALDDTIFTIEEIESKELPNINDIIINTGTSESNGFYKVVNIIDNQTVQTQRLPIGGGGGGGTDGGGPSAGSVLLETIFPVDNTDTIIEGTKYIIKYRVTAKYADGSMVGGKGTATWRINGEQIPGGQIVNGENEFDVTSYLNSSLDINEIRLAVSFDTGGTNLTTTSRTWNISVVNLTLDWDIDYNSQNYYINDSTFTLSWTPRGGFACTTHILFDSKYDSEHYFTKEISSRESNKPASITLSSLPYGVHDVQMWLSADIDGDGEDETKTEPIRHQLMFIKDGNSPLLAVPFYATTARQYDTLNFPFKVYNPNSDTAHVEFYINNGYISGDDFNRNLQSWNYNIGIYGLIEFEIRSGSASWKHEIQVNQLDLQVTEPTGHNLKIKASNYSTNEDLRNLERERIVTFSENFDWDNGGLKSEVLNAGTENERTLNYICIKHHTSMTINYKLFGNDGKLNGKEFKFIFKTAECNNYNAQVLKCVDGQNSEGALQTNIGINITAQEAWFSSGAQTLSTKYREDSYVELEAQIWRAGQVADSIYSPNHPDNFMMFWVDGIPAGVKVYDSSERFEQYTPQNIVVGSEDCDVYVYLVKIYERQLNTEEHMSNFILDAPSSIDIIERYNRNDILDTDGRYISWSKVLEKNPDCLINTYRIDRMTKNKKDKVAGCDFKQYKTSNKLPDYTAKNVTIKVQGTSSAQYGVAAYNLDSEFTEGFVDKDGNELTGWSMRPGSIPVDYTCTKVNVASCENANNPLNQEWYNKFQPYHDAHRRKLEGARDCMEFVPGLLFIRDDNSVINLKDADTYSNSNIFCDDSHYMALSNDKKPYLLYSICNMGNSKDNVHIFHDLDNVNACCVEVSDNQNQEHWMQVMVSDDIFVQKYEPALDENGNQKYDENGAPIMNEISLPYEFRYPDGNDEAEDMHKEAFVNFVNWMAISNPTKITYLVGDAYYTCVHDYTQVNNNLGYIDGDIDVLKSKTYTNDLSLIENGKYLLIDAPSSAQFAQFSEEDKELYVLNESQIFTPYTFRGFAPPGTDDKGQAFSNDSILKGTTVTEFANTYTHNTIEYRMAKMLSECEDHLVMDSILYHYLFIERHTMVDNVAKNTFWSTEDLIHWDLTKNYDNDTADGNNNTGNLVFSYGLETTDRQSAAENAAYVFNAIESVWIQFAQRMKQANRHLYQQLGSQGAWNPITYLQAFKDYQDIIPERCWIEDYFRKYIRPRRLGLDNDTFLNRLEGGKKTHQRDQYETYQDAYLNSKYQAVATSDVMDMRLNAAKLQKDYIVPISMYIDSYVYAIIGGQTYHGRAKRGQTVNIPVGNLITNPNDSTCYFYLASYIQSIKNLPNVYPTYINAAPAKRLIEVELGNGDPNYHNNNINSANFSSNTRMQKLNVQNIGVSRDTTSSDENNSNTTWKGLGSLNLTELKSLSELYMDGSTYTSFTAPENGILQKLKLNGVTDLKMIGLDKLDLFTYDNDLKTNLQSLTLIDCPSIIDSYILVMESTNLLYYLLQGVNWNVANNSVDAGNKLVAIDVLDKLESKKIADSNVNRALSLTGTLTIDQNCIVNKFEIYNKYNRIFPNLIINYSDKVQFEEGTKSFTLTFKENDTESAVDMFTVMTDGKQSMATLLSEEGPAGSSITNPFKDSSVEYSYEWNPNDDNTDWVCQYVDDAGDLQEVEYTHAELLALTAEQIPQYDLIFIPQFISHLRLYTVRLFDENGQDVTDNPTLELKIFNSDGEDVSGSIDLSAGVPYGSVLQTTSYIYREHNLSHMRNSFKGWISAKDYIGGISNPTPITDFTIRENTHLYMYFKEENIFLVPSDSKYFIIEQITSGGRTYPAVSLNPEWIGKVKGKLTLPTVLKGTYITAMGNIPADKGITVISCLADSKIELIKADACALNDATYMNSTLQTIYFPPKLTTIGAQAFSDVVTLKNLYVRTESDLVNNWFKSWEDSNISVINSYAFMITFAPILGNHPRELTIDALPKNLQVLGRNAFQYQGDGVYLSSIPPKVQHLPAYCFNECKNVLIKIFGGLSNSVTFNSQLKSIEDSCFRNAGTLRRGEATHIYILPSVTAVDELAFWGYGGSVTNSAVVDTTGEEFIWMVSTNLQKIYVGKDPDSYTATSSNIQVPIYRWFGLSAIANANGELNYIDANDLVEVKTDDASWNEILKPEIQ